MTLAGLRKFVQVLRYGTLFLLGLMAGLVIGRG